VDGTNHHGCTALAVAASRGHEGVVKILLARGADASAVTPNGHTPLMNAAGKGHTSVVALLLEGDGGKEGIDAKNDRGASALHLASAGGPLDVVRLLLKRGAGVRLQDERGSMPLARAAQHGHEEVVKALLDNGANVNRVDKSGWVYPGHEGGGRRGVIAGSWRLCSIAGRMRRSGRACDGQTDGGDPGQG
jgi:ankyrin repeat protein